MIPCYDEAKRLDVDGFRTYLARSEPVRLVFVDDGSRDPTPDMLHKIRAGYEDRAELLRMDINRGKGEAVRFGLNYALKNFEQDAIGFWDADLATPLDSITRFLGVLDRDPHIQMVFGSRVKLLGRSVVRRPVRHYLGRVFATIVSTMLRLPIYDTQCGAKLFRVNPDTPKIFAEPFVSKWVFDVEIIARCLRLHRDDTKRVEQMIYEYPLETWIDIAGSKVRATDFLRATLDIVRIWRKYLASMRRSR